MHIIDNVKLKLDSANRFMSIYQKQYRHPTDLNNFKLSHARNSEFANQIDRKKVSFNFDEKQIHNHRKVIVPNCSGKEADQDDSSERRELLRKQLKDKEYPAGVRVEYGH